MKESYREDVASHSGLEPYAGDGNAAGVASARGNAGQPLSSEIITFACRSCPDTEKATPSTPLYGEAAADATESKTLCMRRDPDSTTVGDATGISGEGGQDGRFLRRPEGLRRNQPRQGRPVGGRSREACQTA